MLYLVCFHTWNVPTCTYSVGWRRNVYSTAAQSAGQKTHMCRYCCTSVHTSFFMDTCTSLQHTPQQCGEQLKSWPLFLLSATPKSSYFLSAFSCPRWSLAMQLVARPVSDDASLHQIMTLMDQVQTLKVLYARLQDAVEREECWEAAAVHGDVSVHTVKEWDSKFRTDGKLSVSFQHVKYVVVLYTCTYCCAHSTQRVFFSIHIQGKLIKRITCPCAPCCLQ